MFFWYFTTAELLKFPWALPAALTIFVIDESRIGAEKR